MNKRTVRFIIPCRHLVYSLFADLSSQTWLTGGKTATSFSFGYVRVEVLTHFSVLCLGLLLNCWTVKKSLELTLLQLPEEQGIHTSVFFIPYTMLTMFHNYY